MAFHPVGFLLDLPRRAWPLVAAWALSRVLPPWAAFAALVAALGAAAGLGCLLLRRCRVGEFGWKNRAAGWLLPHGFAFGGGSLKQIAATAVGVGSALGGVVLLALGTAGARAPAPAAGPAEVGPGWLVAAWLVDVLCLLHLVPTRWRNFATGTSGARTLDRLTALVVVQLVASGVLHLQGRTGLAALVAGGPQLVLGALYGLFVLAMVTLGRNARWN